VIVATPVTADVVISVESRVAVRESEMPLALATMRVVP